ncbi:MAG: putative glycoside hydrolase [Nitrospirae bacterium]|nr:putative glycoside hydrolase [Nitrospirota bacterium]
MWNYLILGASLLISFAFAVSEYLPDSHYITSSRPMELQEQNSVRTLPYPASLRVEKPEVKGIHVTSWITGDRRYFPDLIKLIDDTELNTIVIDLKETDGRIAYDADVPLARSSGSIQKRIRNLDGVIVECKRHNIYKIARIVLFKDTYLAEKRPDLAIKNKATNGLWRDYKGDAFTSPYSKEVWDYNLSLAEDAARRGFDEIQFDYIRFPSDGPLKDILYPEGHDEDKAVSVISSFVEEAGRRLSPYKVKLSVDVFGLTTLRDDVGIGQNFKELIDRVDYISPMIYPSHYWKGSYGYQNPNNAPYDIIKLSLRDAIRKSVDQSQDEAMIRDKIRPWLQDFSLGYPSYGAEEVRAQIRAANDLGIKEWLLWNPSVRYTKNALLSQTRGS